MISKNDHIRVHVKAFGILRQLIEDQSIEFGKAPSLSEVIKLLAEKVGVKLKELILDSRTNEVSSSVGIMINGRVGHNLNESLRDGDEVTLFILVAGG